MTDYGRRDFFRRSSWGLAAIGVGACQLRADAEPTKSSGALGDYQLVLAEESVIAAQEAPADFTPTADNILGPYYREGAPYRAKITPPQVAGTALLVRGRVWANDTRRPLPGAVLDIWQADHHGRYDNDDPKLPPAPGVFVNRARLLTDEQGYYEYETVHPGRYTIGPNRWRPAHIHYFVRRAGYKQLVTQLYFAGDPENERDEFIKKSLIIELQVVRGERGTYESGVFDIVLAKA